MRFLIMHERATPGSVRDRRPAGRRPALPPPGNMPAGYFPSHACIARSASGLPTTYHPQRPTYRNHVLSTSIHGAWTN
uniref:Uncharacterized protein n=1 Tax=Aegilops tauschii subsp. strangulata TaxID=200361 RepID=A0A453QUC9_AEGTS